LTGEAGSNWWLGKNLILTFRTFDLIGRSSVGVRTSVGVVRWSGSYAWFDRTFDLVFEEAQDTAKVVAEIEKAFEMR
jgi:hypothetical protein